MEDAKILDLYFARDEDAIRETDTAYGKRLHTLAKNILQNREDAEESVNDTYAEVWKSKPASATQVFLCVSGLDLPSPLPEPRGLEAGRQAPRPGRSPHRRNGKLHPRYRSRAADGGKGAGQAARTYFWKV